MSDWQPIETAPRDGMFLVVNRLGQVCVADSRDGQRVVHNMPGFCEWDFMEPATHWLPLPPPPKTEK